MDTVMEPQVQMRQGVSHQVARPSNPSTTEGSTHIVEPSHENESIEREQPDFITGSAAADRITTRAKSDGIKGTLDALADGDIDFGKKKDEATSDTKNNEEVKKKEDIDQDIETEKSNEPINEKSEKAKDQFPYEERLKELEQENESLTSRLQALEEKHETLEKKVKDMETFFRLLEEFAKEDVDETDEEKKKKKQMFQLLIEFVTRFLEEMFKPEEGVVEMNKKEKPQGLKVLQMKPKEPVEAIAA